LEIRWQEKDKPSNRYRERETVWIREDELKLDLQSASC